MNKCIGAIEEFEFLPLSSGKHLHLTIAVTGWLCGGKFSKSVSPDQLWSVDLLKALYVRILRETYYGVFPTSKHSI